MSRPVVIGTRGSELALWQAHEVQRRLGGETELRIIKTSGDMFLGAPLQGGLEQGFFTKDIEAQLLAGEIDLAVHSLKDLPTALAPGLAIGAYLKRAPVSDLLLVHPDYHDPAGLLPLRPGAEVGATSLRRQALLRLYAPQVEARMLRGNVPGRIAKCLAGEYGAIVLARAGVGRLGLDTAALHVYELDAVRWLPAPGQGAIAVQCREGDARVLELLAPLNDADTEQAVCLERRLLGNFEGGCHTAFGAWARRAAAAWQVHLGMELGGVWGQCEQAGEYAALEGIGPGSGLGFTPPQASAQEELCLPLRG